MFANLEGTVGNPPVTPLASGLSTVPLFGQGAVVPMADPWWGAGEFMYGRADATIRSRGVCMVQPVFDAALGGYRYDVVEVTNTANLGRAVCVAMQAMVQGQYGWFQVGGLTPVDCTASVAAGTVVGIAAAGQAGANSAGKQLLGATSRVAAAATVVKAGCQADAGSLTLSVPNADGWFPGVYLSGTGIAALTRVASISPDGRIVTLTVATSAPVTTAVTATYNNATIFYNVLHIARPIAQGAIT